MRDGEMERGTREFASSVEYTLRVGFWKGLEQRGGCEEGQSRCRGGCPARGACSEIGAK